MALLFLYFSEIKLRIILFRGVFEFLKVSTVKIYVFLDVIPYSLVGIAEISTETTASIYPEEEAACSPYNILNIGQTVRHYVLYDSILQFQFKSIAILAVYFGGIKT